MVILPHFDLIIMYSRWFRDMKLLLQSTEGCIFSFKLFSFVVLSGNREDGYLFGIDNMISIMEELLQDEKEQDT